MPAPVTTSTLRSASVASSSSRSEISSRRATDSALRRSGWSSVSTAISGGCRSMRTIVGHGVDPSGAASSGATTTITLPVFAPVNSALSASGAASSPSKTCSRQVSRPSSAQPSQLVEALGEAVPVVERDEALHAPAPRDQVEVVGRTGRAALVVVGRDGAAQHDATVLVQPAEHGVEDGSADVVEVHVDAIGAELGQLAGEVGGAVVDAAVEAQVVDDPRALLVGPGDADHPAAEDLGDLPGDRTGGAAGGRHDHGLARP